MLVQQSFVVPDNSRIRRVADIDAQGLRIAGGKGIRSALYLARNLKHATLVETGPHARRCKGVSCWPGEIDAYGANRQRLTNLLREMPGYRLLPDSLFGVTQAIIVAKGKPVVS
jgi:polar amino acid transport system substrate-binding protein